MNYSEINNYISFLKSNWKTDLEMPSILWYVIIIVPIGCLTIWFLYYLIKEIYYSYCECKIISQKPTASSIIHIDCDKQSKTWWKQARIYHIMVDRFNGGWITPPSLPDDKNGFVGGTLKGIIEKLDYISEMGYNAIMLTPVSESAAYHGYHTIAYDKIDSHFGTWIDFCQLVKAAHEKQIKIICDYVPNHCHESNPIFIEARKNPNSKKRNWFYFKKDAPNEYVCYQGYKELPKFNLTNWEAMEYMVQVAEMLVQCGVDGLRIDHVIGVPFGFLYKLRSRIKQQNPDVFIFGEATAIGITDFEQISFRDECMRNMAMKGGLSRDDWQKQYVDVLDGVLDFEYQDLIISEVKRGSRILGNHELERRVQEHFSRYPENFKLVLFLDNHDTERFMYFIDQYANGDSSLLCEAIQFTMQQPYPMCVYYGTELRMSHDEPVIGGKPYADSQVRKPMKWGEF